MSKDELRIAQLEDALMRAEYDLSCSVEEQNHLAAENSQLISALEQVQRVCRRWASAGGDVSAAECVAQVDHIIERTQKTPQTQPPTKIVEPNGTE